MQAVQLLEAENGCDAPDLVKRARARKTQLHLGAIRVALARHDEERLRALRIIRAFEFGQRRIDVALALHFKDVTEPLALRVRPPHHVVIIKLGFGVITERVPDVQEHLLHVCVRIRSRAGRLRVRHVERKTWRFVGEAPPPLLRDRPLPTLVALDLSLLVERATGALHVSPPRAQFAVRERVLVLLCELRKVSDETLIEKTHVVNAACGDEFLQDREFESGDTGERHDVLRERFGMTLQLALHRESYKRNAGLIKPRKARAGDKLSCHPPCCVWFQSSMPRRRLFACQSILESLPSRACRVPSNRRRGARSLRGARQRCRKRSEE